ncbi:MAG: response regulator [Syntrophales bacterium]|nr:response regulator [Syntrophales bacterium]
MKGESVVILLVEDKPAHAEAIRRALKGSGADMEIHTVQTLQAYREAVAANPSDIALLDLNLPNGRGVEVLTAPPEAGPFPILIMTSHGNEQTAVEAMKAGALDYIVKSPEAFVAMPRTVTHALREWRLLQERKQAEEALKASEKKYRQLIDTLQEGIWVIDSGGTTTFVNAAMAEMLGYTTDEMLGKHLFSFLDDQGVEISKQILELCKQGIKKRFDSEFMPTNCSCRSIFCVPPWMFHTVTTKSGMAPATRGA